MTSSLQRVVEYDSNRMTISGTDTADPMPQIDTMDPMRPLHLTVLDRKSHGVALSKRHDLYSRLHARTLLGQHEFTTREVSAGFREQNRDLWMGNTCSP